MLGGLNKDNIPLVLEAGADMICAISASLAGGKVTENIREMMAGCCRGEFEEVDK